VSTPLVSARAVRGELRLRAERDATGRTVLTHRHAAGAFHLSKPYWDGHALMVQWINPTAGIFAGDVLTSEVSVGPDAAMLVTTPSATRIHTRRDPSSPAGEQHQRFTVDERGWLEVQSEWLMPQRDSTFLQHTEIDLGSGTGLFYTELLAPGRVAHGEALLFDELHLRLKVRSEGKLIMQDQLRCDRARLWPLQDGEQQPLFMATVLVQIPGMKSQAERLAQTAINSLNSCSGGVTSISADMLAIRLVASQGRPIRATIHRLRTALAELASPLKGDLRKL
jgi:urease accessory protein